MAKYTLELRTIANSPYSKLFDFDYELYNNDLKPVFEQKFIDYFYFDEIGFETIQKFKHMLKTQLNTIMPYYKQIYETELRCQDIDFMLQKDLTETFIREIQNNSNMTSSVKSDGRNNNTNYSIHTDTPQSKVNNIYSDIEKYVSSADKDTTTHGYNDHSNSIADNSSNGTEKTELISRGNIGVSSMATLVKKWRQILINIDEMIFRELQDLFMQVY